MLPATAENSAFAETEDPLLLPNVFPQDNLTDAFRAQSPEWQQRFWELAVEGYVNLLRRSDAVSGSRARRPVLPAPGGFGSMNLESREHLCANYLAGESPDYRAYLQLRLLAEPIDDRGAHDHRQAREFRLAWAMFFESYPLEVQGRIVGLEVGPEERWRLGLAICAELASTEGDEDELVTFCSTIFDRFIRNRDPAKVAPLAGGAGFAIDIGRSDQWEAVKAVLLDQSQQGVLLARLMFHVVCARLQIAPKRQQRFTDAWLQWLSDIAKDASSGSACSPECGAAPAQSMLFALCKIRPFGGGITLDPGEGFPRCFRPYCGGPRQWLESIQDALDPAGPHEVDHRAAVRGAYLLGVAMADKLSDLIQVHSNQKADGPGFKPAAYKNLAELIGTTQKELKKGQPTQGKPGFSAHSHQLQRLFTELGRPDERLYAAMAEIQPSGGRQALRTCPMCTRAPANRPMPFSR